MVTIQIEQFYIRGLKKIPANCRYSMSCYFEEHLFKTWNNLFLDLQECSHYAEGFLLENLIQKDNVVTMVTNYEIEKEPKKIFMQGLPYGVQYKRKNKYKVFPA
jgi:hypothetical protein